MATRSSLLRVLALALMLAAAEARSRHAGRMVTAAEMATRDGQSDGSLTQLKISRLMLLLKSLGVGRLVQSESKAASNTAEAPGSSNSLKGNLGMEEDLYSKEDGLRQLMEKRTDVHEDLSLRSMQKRALSNADTDLYGEHLNPTDFKNARNSDNRLPTDRPANFIDPTENVNRQDLFEGDIAHGQREGRNIIMNPDKRWPRGDIPYVIASGFSSSERAAIASAVLEFEQNTCIRVRPLSPSDSIDQSYVHIIRGDGCYSSVGRQLEPGQELSLGNGCLYPGIVVHEFMHAVGFWHEQSRPDRDEHVRIHYDNIKHGKEYNFKAYTKNQVQTKGEPYDVGSIMHYGPRAFARDRSRPTISPLKPTTAEMGQREGLSRIDINKINKLYGCKGATAPPTPVVKPTKCADRNVYCGTWATNGECKANPLYMQMHCAQSCDTCSSGKCEDKNKHCAVWAETGECTNTPSYMSLYCRQSCGLCKGADTVSCTNVSPFCEAWAAQGECKENPDYMKIDCRKACGLC